MKDLKEWVGVGRRKTAVASVRLRKGSGKILVNKQDVEKHFPLEFQREILLAPLKKLELSDQYDLVIRVKGGGVEGQAMASRLGVARALVVKDEDNKIELKACGYLTRDPRKRERKKYGLAGARKKFQFSKR